MNTAHMSTQQKTFFTGTHRLVPPQVTWERVKRVLPVIGVTRIADITGLDTCGIPVAVAFRPTALTLTVSSGKGVTPLLAKVGAAMESMEMWHAERPPAAAIPSAAARALDLPYSLDALPLAAGSVLTPSTPLEWLPGRGAVSGEAVLVPRALIHLTSVVSDRWDPPLFLATSNGLASGNSIIEATQHALLEVVERQCLLEFHRDPATARLVAPGSIDDPTVVELVDKLEASGNLLRILDLTNGMGVPCYQAEIRNEALPFTFAGAGCHTAAGVALSRAITEAAQSRLGVIAGSRDDLDDEFYRMVHDPGRGRGHEMPPAPAGGTGPPRADVAAGTFDQDVRLLAVRIVEATGHEPIVVDLTSPECGLPVVRVVAPGLGFDARVEFVPGTPGPAAAAQGER